MIEKFTDVFTKGTKMTFKNPVLFLPYLLYIVLVILLYGIMAVATYINVQTAIIFSILYILFGFILVILEYFIRVGLLGMAKDVVLTGKTSLSQIYRYGKQYFIPVLGIGSITFAVASIGYILLIFALFIFLLMILQYDATGRSSSLTVETAVFFVVVGVGLIWIFVTRLFFYFARYAAVAGDLPFEDAIKRSFSLFKKNKLKVFIFVLIALVLPSIPTLLMYSVYFMSSSSLMVISGPDDQALLIWTLIIIAVIFLATIIFPALIPVWSTNMYLWLANKESETEAEEANETKTVEETETSIEYQEQEVSFD